MSLAVAGLAQRWWRARCLPWLCVCAWLAAPVLHASELSAPLPAPVLSAGEAGPAQDAAAADVPRSTPQARDPDEQAAVPSTGRGLSPPSERPAVHWPGDFDPPANSSPNPIGLRASPDALPGPATGLASWYGPGFHGRRTASGELFSRHEMTAAHRTLPLGSLLHVTNPETGVGVVVRINDRGPFHGNRVIDLSQAAASALGIVAKGVGRVDLRLPSDDEAAEFASRLADAARQSAGAGAVVAASARVPRRPLPKQARLNRPAAPSAPKLAAKTDKATKAAKPASFAASNRLASSSPR